MMSFIVFLTSLMIGLVVNSGVAVGTPVTSPDGKYIAVQERVGDNGCEYFVTHAEGGFSTSGQFTDCRTSFWVSWQGTQVYVVRTAMGHIGLDFSGPDGDPVHGLEYATVEYYIMYSLGLKR